MLRVLVLEDHLRRSCLHLYLLFAVRGALSLMSLAAACIRLFHVNCVGNHRCGVWFLFRV